MTPDLWTTIFIAAISAISGVIAGYIALRKLPVERKAAETETTATMVKGVYGPILDDLQSRIDDLEQDRQRQRVRIEELQTQVDMSRKRSDEDREKLLRVQLQLEQAFERIAALEAENEVLQEENEKLREKLYGEA